MDTSGLLKSEWLQLYHISSCWVLMTLLLGELPQKLFSRHERLSYSEITSCKCDESQRWFALTGLTPQVIFSRCDYWLITLACYQYRCYILSYNLMSLFNIICCMFTVANSIVYVQNSDKLCRLSASWERHSCTRKINDWRSVFTPTAFC